MTTKEELKKELAEHGIVFLPYDMSLPTYWEFTKDWNLADKLKFHYDVDLDNFTGDVWEIFSDALTNPNWLKEFEIDVQENLIEKEYIRPDPDFLLRRENEFTKEEYKKYIGKKVEWVVDYGDPNLKVQHNDIETIHNILWAGNVEGDAGPFEEHMFLNEYGDRWMPLDYVLSHLIE